MAGSRRWYVYVDDRDKRWGAELDEDNGSLAGAGFVAVASGDDLDTMPRGMEMRGVYAVQTSGAGAGYVSTFQPCATKTAGIYAGTTKTWTKNGLNYSLTSTRGETRRIPKALNTGQTGNSPSVGGGGTGGGSGT